MIRIINIYTSVRLYKNNNNTTNVWGKRNRGYIILYGFLEQDQGNIRSAHSSVFDKRKTHYIKFGVCKIVHEPSNFV